MIGRLCSSSDKFVNNLLFTSSLLLTVQESSVLLIVMKFRRFYCMLKMSSEGQRQRHLYIDGELKKWP